MSDIVTIANVSGFIAVAIVVVQFILPTLLVLALACILGHENSAVTWSVAGKLVQESWWPTLLQSDTVSSKGVRRGAQIISWIKTLGTLLVVVAGVVTPLGLYDGLSEAQPTVVTFSYVSDEGPFGYATPERSNLGFIRECQQAVRPVSCPGVNENSQAVLDEDGEIFEFEFPWGRDGNIPQDRYDYFQSGVNRNSSTISSFWDIEYRQYRIDSQRGSPNPINNGSEYLIGSFEPFENTINVPRIVAIEGLIVDSINGSIGFRNHSMPENNGALSAWSEDLLFLEPETQCIPNNLSLTFSIADESTELGSISDIQLVDLGGFYATDWDNFPEYNGTDSQNNLDLRQRAYRAAFLNNMVTGWYFNVTDYADPGSETPLRPRQFSYLNSEHGRTIDLRYNGSTTADTLIFPDRFRTSQMFSDFLNFGDGFLSDAVPGPNPFNVTGEDFQAVFDECRWFSERNPGNISTVAVSCLMAYGLGSVDGQDSRPAQPQMLRPGAQISIPLYTCATAVKASIKTVAFHSNGTSWSSFGVDSISEKQYEQGELPTWGVEDIDPLALDTTKPIWGLVDPDLTPIQNVSLIQRDHLYLPGMVSDPSAFDSDFSVVSENMPGSDLVTGTLTSLGLISSNDNSGIWFSNYQTDIISAAPDYSGRGNPPLMRRWRELMVNGQGVATALNLVWTDLMASLVVGTKGVTGTRSENHPGQLAKRQDPGPQSQNSSPPIVRVSERTVLYRWRFSAPAFLVIALVIFVTVATFVLCIIKGSFLGSVRVALERTSTGRLMGSFLYSDRCPPRASTKEWVTRVGMFPVNYSGPTPSRHAIHHQPLVLQEYTKDAEDNYYYSKQ